jgi:hypothetical protein
MAGVEQALAYHVPKDRAVPSSDGVEQDKVIASMGASRITAPVITGADVDQALAYHVPKDLAVPNSDGVEQDNAIAAMDARGGE